MKIAFTPIALLCSSLCLGLTTTQVSAKEYYKWVDSKGSTHYTTTPPPKNAQRKGKVSTYGASQSTQASPTQNNENVSREAEKQDQQQQDQQREANEALRQGQAVSAAPQ